MSQGPSLREPSSLSFNGFWLYELTLGLTLKGVSLFCDSSYILFF